MRVGVIGLGKLGLPVAYAMAARGLEVWGFDPVVKGPPDDTSHEADLAWAIRTGRDRMHFAAGVEEVVQKAEIIFLAVQTPHGAEYEGITPLPETRADFDYSHLIAAAKQVNGAAERTRRFITLAVISTVLPGTMRREIAPLLHSRVSLTYNPSFIAMGTTIRDFLDPEFALIGNDPRGVVREVYEACGVERFYETSIENAELIKVAYNTFIGLKLAFANTLMEVCHKTAGTDVDEVTGALKLANRRLISDAYLSGGMGDGGGCHPRDNIALSWLARELDLSFDLFEAAMLQRERQSAWLASLLEEEAHKRNLPLGILGTAYKPGSHLDTGSPALLVAEILRQRGITPYLFDPHVEPTVPTPADPHAWIVGCKHPEFLELTLPRGSIVVDPFRYIPDQEGVEVLGIGSVSHHRTAREGGAVSTAAA